ncbi:peptidylprolyl isomerase [Zoogloea oleivorans]|uniref:peptidylprolyl isomerase n=1 Tax=Zoogloea oleivorans TaxID=1552750 RepID=A0A6C2D2Y0_9RHOO|nr:peptidylprolyl isomerase [Zoogloea oleivorans]TYC60133.1 peptidylprolyl isomerase [Zoogloea oleivorans]
MKLSTLYLVPFFVTLVSSQSVCAADEVVVTHAKVTVSSADLQADMAGRSPELLKRMREPDSPSAERMAADIMLRRLVANKAREEGLVTRKDILDRLKLAEERALYEIYMEQAESKTVSESQIEAIARDEYKAFPEKFTKPEEVRARHILFRACGSDRTASRALAESVLEKLRNGESFEELAQKYSDDPGSGRRGGDLGMKPKGAMVPEFEAVAFAMKKPGELSGIVETNFGLHIIRFEERQAPVLRPFDEVKDALMESVRNRMRGEVRKKIADPLRDPAAIKIDADAVRRAVSK